MQEHKTQQFAKFFIKDLKNKNSKYNKEPNLKDLTFTSSVN